MVEVKAVSGTLITIFEAMGVLDPAVCHGVSKGVKEMYSFAQENNLTLKGIVVVVDDISCHVAMYPIESCDDKAVTIAKEFIEWLRDDKVFQVRSGSEITGAKLAEDPELLTPEELLECCVLLANALPETRQLAGSSMRRMSESIAFSDPMMLSALREPKEGYAPVIMVGLIKEIDDKVRFTSHIVNCLGANQFYGSARVH